MSETQRVIDKMVKDFDINAELTLGYPINKDFDYSALYPLLKFSVNNVGDAFAEGNMKVNTHVQEREVINRYKTLLHGSEEDTWGYVNNGGSEGNLYGMYLASQKFPDATIYYSRDSHYSISKAAKLVGLKVREITTHPSGKIRTSHLRKELMDSANPAIVFANVGTTFRGAIDDVVVIKSMLDEIKPDQHYIHADAAFFGNTIPFYSEGGLPFDFRAGINSISISGHKFIGSPIPCGVVLARVVDVKNIESEISYVRTHDNTLSGSRNGITPMFLWYSIKTISKSDFTDRVHHSLDMADYFIKELRGIGVYSWRNINSPIVVFPAPPEDLIKKYQIATEDGDAHIVGLPSTSKESIDRFILDFGEYL